MLKPWKIEGFRAPDNAYWDYFYGDGIKDKQISPFIVMCPDKESVIAVFRAHELRAFPADYLVFHAWPGKWKTDVFHFRISDAIAAMDTL